MNEFIEIDKDVFYGIIDKNKLDVVISVHGEFPYTVIFKFKDGRIFGKHVEEWHDGVKDKRPIVSKYFINKEFK